MTDAKPWQRYNDLVITAANGTPLAFKADCTRLAREVLLLRRLAEYAAHRADCPAGMSFGGPCACFLEQLQAAYDAQREAFVPFMSWLDQPQTASPNESREPV